MRFVLASVRAPRDSKKKQIPRANPALGMTGHLFERPPSLRPAPAKDAGKARTRDYAPFFVRAGGMTAGVSFPQPVSPLKVCFRLSQVGSTARPIGAGSLRGLEKCATLDFEAQARCRTMRRHSNSRMQSLSASPPAAALREEAPPG